MKTMFPVVSKKSLLHLLVISSILSQGAVVGFQQRPTACSNNNIQRSLCNRKNQQQHHDHHHSSRGTLQLSQSYSLRRSICTLSMWSGEDGLEGTDRIKACVPYLLPLIDGYPFGTYIYQRIPPLGEVNDFLLSPLVNLFHSIPFLGITVFVALTLGTRGNTDMARGVRFNAQQAALIDVALVFPELIAGAFEDEPLPRSIAEPCSNFVYYSYVTAICYSVISNLRGKKPNQIPYISDFAELAVGPF